MTIMHNKKKTAYVAPGITSVSIKAERGYALSFPELTLWDLNESAYGSQQMEAYETGNGWNSGSNHFWD